MAGGEPPGIRAVVNYVLNPSAVTLEQLPWKECCDADIYGKRLGFVVYRGQSKAPKGNIPRLGDDPDKIRLDLGRPLSTSTQLNQHIESFAAPRGRLFMIHVTPGVKYVDIRKEIKRVEISDAFFRSIQENLPEGHGLKTKTLAQVKGEFWRRVAKENEVILNPTDVFFRSETTPRETWNRMDAWKEVDLKEVYEKSGKRIDQNTGEEIEYKTGEPTGVIRKVNVYETGLWPLPKAGRRGRTFRSKTLRRNKHGSRPARQSKHSVRNRHA